MISFFFRKAISFIVIATIMFFITIIPCMLLGTYIAGSNQLDFWNWAPVFKMLHLVLCVTIYGYTKTDYENVYKVINSCIDLVLWRKI